MSVGSDLHEWARNDQKSMSSITDDETWVHGYDQEIKQMSSQLQPTSFPQLKVWEVTFNVKTVLLVIFDFDGLAHHTVCPLGAEYEYWILQNGPAVPPRPVSWHYPEKWCISNWVLKHDNVPVHRSVTTYFWWNNIPLLLRFPYSPDMALCKIFLFHNWRKLKCHWFDKVEEIQAWGILWQMRTITITKCAYQRCFYH